MVSQMLSLIFVRPLEKCGSLKYNDHDVAGHWPVPPYIGNHYVSSQCRPGTCTFEDEIGHYLLRLRKKLLTNLIRIQFFEASMASQKRAYTLRFCIKFLCRMLQASVQFFLESNFSPVVARGAQKDRAPTSKPPLSALR